MGLQSKTIGKKTGAVKFKKTGFHLFHLSINLPNMGTIDERHDVMLDEEGGAFVPIIEVFSNPAPGEISAYMNAHSSWAAKWDDPEAAVSFLIEKNATDVDDNQILFSSASCPPTDFIHLHVETFAEDLNFLRFTYNVNFGVIFTSCNDKSLKSSAFILIKKSAFKQINPNQQKGWQVHKIF